MVDITIVNGGVIMVYKPYVFAKKKTLRCLDDSLATNAVSRNRSPAVDLEPRSAPIGNPVASGNHKMTWK